MAATYKFVAGDNQSGAEVILAPNWFVSAGIGYEGKVKLPGTTSREVLPPKVDGSLFGGFNRERANEAKVATVQLYVNPVKIWKIRPALGVGPTFNWTERTDVLTPFIFDGADLGGLHPILVDQLRGQPMVDKTKKREVGGVASLGGKFITKHVIVSAKVSRLFFQGGVEHDVFSVDVGPRFKLF